MKINISVIPLKGPKKHLLLLANGGTPIVAAYNLAYPFVCELGKAWREIEDILNNKWMKSSEDDAVAILDKLIEFRHHMAKSVGNYQLHPTLMLSLHLQEGFSLAYPPLVDKTNERNKEKEIDKKALFLILDGYVTTLSDKLNKLSHREECANFDRLSRRKKPRVRQWLNYQMSSQKQAVINVVLYQSLNAPRDRREKLIAAIARFNYTINNRQAIWRQCNGYIWQLRHDAGIGYYVDWLFAIPSDCDKKAFLNQLYEEWKGAWKKTIGLSQNVPLPFVDQDQDSVFLGESAEAPIDNIADYYCLLDGIMKLNLPASVKTYGMSRIPKS